MKSKKVIKNQIYEDYWKLTLEYTDYMGKPFNETLSTIVDFIDRHKGNITEGIYSALQIELNDKFKKSDLASTRKSINQFLKLGFINNHMKSYHIKTKDFLKENNKSIKKRLYSEIIYDNSSFKRSYSVFSTDNEINFLVKTIEECGEITFNELLAIMYSKVSEYEAGYLNRKDLDSLVKSIDVDERRRRKYNQEGYLLNLIRNVLYGVYIKQKNGVDMISLEPDEQANILKLKQGRDPYKQRLYKFDLYQESLQIRNRISCFYDDISYPVLIASHIKPYNVCDGNERFDPNNGLLLSRTMDQLFDSGWITFSDNGAVVCADNLDKNLKNKLSSQCLNLEFLKNPIRLEYLKYHREHVFDKNKKYSYL